MLNLFTEIYRRLKAVDTLINSYQFHYKSKKTYQESTVHKKTNLMSLKLTLTLKLG